MGTVLRCGRYDGTGDARRQAASADTSGYSSPYIRAVAYGSAFYGFLAIVLSISAVRRHALAAFDGRADRSRLDLVAGVLVWVGTPLLFYMYIAPPYAHAPSAFAVALFVWVWLNVRRTWSPGGAVALGLAGALMAMVREQDGLLVIGPAVDFALSAIRQPGRRALLPAAAGSLAFVIGYAPQLLAYEALNGYPGPSKLVVRKMTWYSPHALQVLLSTEHGFFFWTPLAVAAVAGLLMLALRGHHDSRRIGWCALLMLVAQVYVSGSVESWKVAGAFGQRRFVAITVLLVIGLSVLLRAVPRGPGRVVTAVALALCLWWNLALTALFGTGLMDRQRLELGRNAYDAFVTIPRMAPDLAVRYLTRRDSFYQRGQQP